MIKDVIISKEFYEIEKVVKEKGQPITYFYRNDRDSLTPLYENEFYVTKERVDY